MSEELESGVKIIQIIEIYDNGHENTFDDVEGYFKRVRGATRLISEFVNDLNKLDDDLFKDCTFKTTESIRYLIKKWEEKL